MARAKSVLLMFIVFISTAILTSCGSSNGKNSAQSGGSSDAGKSGGSVVVDTAKAVEKSVAAGEGGELSLQSGDGGTVKVIFPQESLAKDASLMIAPVSGTPFDGKDLLVKGFSLEEKGTGKGPVMKSPALIIFNVKGTIPAEASVIKYHDDGGGYDVIPSKVASKDGKSAVVASVSSFSKYGVKLLSPGEKGKSGQEPEDFNWVIYVKDKFSFKTGPMKQSITVDLKAVNTSGYLWGEYKGSISAVTTNDMNVPGGTVTALGKSSDPNLSFTVSLPVVPLVPPQEKDGVVPLTKPGDEPDFSGYGNINMSSSGIATGSYGGIAKSKDIQHRSTVRFEIYIIGPRVRLVVHTPQGAQYYDGFIRGEGK